MEPYKIQINTFSVTYQLLLVHRQKHWHFVHSEYVVEWASLMRGKPLAESFARHEKHQS